MIRNKNSASLVAIKVFLGLLAISTAFYLFTIFYNFYHYHQDLIGNNSIPLKEGFLFLASLLWFPTVALSMLVGSLIQKSWAWHILIFINIFSIYVVINELLFNPSDKFTNYLKLFFYFGFVAASSTKRFKNYYKVHPTVTSYLLVSIVAAATFVTNYYISQ